MSKRSPGDPQLSLEALRRSAASLLACTVWELFPDVLVGESKSTDLGFSCDFLFSQHVTEDFLSMIDEKMRLLCNESHEVRSAQMMRENAAELFQHKNQPLKAELALSKPENIVDIIQIGDFYDLCESPHIPTTNFPIAFKLQSFREVDCGSLKMMRIEGTAFSNKQELKEFLKLLEKAKKNDHCKIGQELKLFKYDSSELCFWLSKGVCLKERLLDFWRQASQSENAQSVVTPKLIPFTLLEEYKIHAAEGEAESLITFDGNEYVYPAPIQLAHALLFQAHAPSEKELPLFFTELCEQPQKNRQDSSLGLYAAAMNTFDFTQIFCTFEQAQNLLSSSLQLILKTITMSDFEYELFLPSQPGSFAGSVKSWQKSVQLLQKSLSDLGLNYRTGAARESHGQFGPCLQVNLIDSLGRRWPGPSLSVDCYHPAKMRLKYRGQDGEEHPPVMIARTLFGSLERFIALLIEKYAGVFPLWLAPEQVRILTVSERHLDLALSLQKDSQEHGFRAIVDSRDEKLAAKIYDAQIERVPYMIVIGDREKQGQVSVRAWNQKETVQVSLSDFFEQLLAETEEINKCRNRA